MAAFAELGNSIGDSIDKLSKEGVPLEHEIIIDRPTAAYLIMILIVGILVPLLIYAFARAYADSYFKNNIKTT